jgi:hypothetical protein
MPPSTPIYKTIKSGLMKIPIMFAKAVLKIAAASSNMEESKNSREKPPTHLKT